MENNKKYIWGAVIVAVIIIIAGFVLTRQSAGPVAGKYDDFAKCLADKNLTMYGAAWCSHCAAQKALFGDSFKFAKYVECPDNTKLCTDLGILGYPTWIDSAGKKYEGEQKLETLASVTGCSLPQ